MPSEQTHPQIPFVPVEYGIVDLFFENGGENGVFCFVLPDIL